MPSLCPQCQRPLQAAEPYDGPVDERGTLIVAHGSFGCDSGCCGVEVVYRTPTGGGRVAILPWHDEDAVLQDVYHHFPAYRSLPVVRLCWVCPQYDERSHDIEEQPRAVRSPAVA